MCSSPGPAESAQPSKGPAPVCSSWATHTVKSTDRPPTFNVILPLPSIGSNSPVTFHSCTVVCSNCVPTGTTSGLISQPTTIVDSVFSSASGGSGFPLPRLCCCAPPLSAGTAWDTVPGVRMSRHSDMRS
ncbi:unnamed protein product [Gadus morhua 'NCC']